MKELLAKYSQVKTVAETEVFGDPRTRPGREMVRRQAQESLPKVRQEVTAAFKKAGFPVFVTDGTIKAANTFTELVADEATTVVADLRKATSNIREAVAATLTKNSEFSPSSFTVFLREVRQTGADLGLTSIPDISYDGPVVVTDINGLVDDYLMKYLGAEFVAAVIEKEALTQVLKLKEAETVIPVLVLGVPSNIKDEVAQKLFQGKFIETKLPATIDGDFVNKTFKAIKTARKQQ